MEKVLISIIMPVFNTEKYLERAILSVLNQTFNDFELIIIDDNSTDNSDSIIKKYEKRDLRIKYIKNNNKGVSNSRNLGIKLSKGKYITFIDSDDYIYEDALKKMYLYITESNNDICMAGYILEMDKIKKKISLPYEDKRILNNIEIKSEIIPNMIAITDYKHKEDLIMGSVWRILVNRKLIIKNKIFFNPEINVAEDLLFCTKLFGLASDMIILKDGFYNYIRYRNTSSECYRKKSLDESILFCREYKKILNDLNIYNVNIERFYIRKLNTYARTIANCFRANPQDYKSIKSEIREIKKVYDADKFDKSQYFKYISFQKIITFKLINLNMISLLAIIFFLRQRIYRNFN